MLLKYLFFIFHCLIFTPKTDDVSGRMCSGICTVCDAALCWSVIAQASPAGRFDKTLKSHIISHVTRSKIAFRECTIIDWPICNQCSNLFLKILMSTWATWDRFSCACVHRFSNLAAQCHVCKQSKLNFEQKMQKILMYAWGCTCFEAMNLD